MKRATSSMFLLLKEAVIMERNGEIMAKLVDKIKKELISEVMTETELENYMAQHSFYFVETDDDKSIEKERTLKTDNGNETITINIFQFTNYKCNMWVEHEWDNDKQVFLITDIRMIARIDNEQTRVEPFRSYEDLTLVLDYFKTNQQYNHWFVACMMVSLGRRVGDTVALKWSDFYTKNGEVRERLTQLKEEKTGKKLGVRINALAKSYLEEYQKLTNANPAEKYSQTIINNTSAAFRKALKIAVSSVGLTYPLSTHSFRKYYANTIYKLHPQDVDKLSIVQAILGHSSPETTKIYINEIDRKIDMYNEDYAGYMLDRGKGIVPEISNSPIMSLKAEDFRELLSLCFNMAAQGSDKFEVINQIISVAETKML